MSPLFYVALVTVFGVMFGLLFLTEYRIKKLKKQAGEQQQS